ncbi:N-acetylmuramoyl-L-alanine amidase family protein [Bacillus sp. CH30_1T]|uniref:peptidoglycan recognition protein family protein n=1 Tax=Bacillus sp. CH30_1T TaxID=2604836 RepID=UPI0011EC24B9|nr:N-acetylmuramoyl-L-alanine amidase [Bacillus sp. CH30_1T]KAA0565350.1 N-acetylmuramoyl-L-alanine amidase family protein [Bacillus sp. CH30_1T]
MVALNYRKDHVIKNKYSRSGDPLIKVQAIVVHYTANPHANAEDHQEFFDGADGGNYRYAGAHIFVDKDEAVEVIPLNEVAYQANEKEPRLSTLKATTSYYPEGNANLLTLSIEMCIEEDGSFHPDTVERTRLVVKYLQNKFPQLRDTKNRVVRHYDVTGKICPKPFVDDVGAWKDFLNSIDQVEKKESKPAAKPQTKPSYVGKRAESIYRGKEGLDFYSKATFNDKYRAGVLHYQYGFPKIVRKLKVEGAYMFEVKNSKGHTYYITAAPKYIKVE